MELLLVLIWSYLFVKEEVKKTLLTDNMIFKDFFDVDHF